MSVILHSSTTSLSVDVGYDLEDRKTELFQRHSTVSGRDVFFDYGEFNRFNLPIIHIPFSDGKQINEWWEDMEELTFEFDSISYTVKVVNTAKPFASIQFPYWDFWKGSVFLGEF